MGQPAPRGRPQDAPPVDPSAVDRAYRLERAKRRARAARARERRLATLRFGIVLTALLALALFLTLTMWQQVEQLFGL